MPCCQCTEQKERNVQQKVRNEKKKESKIRKKYCKYEPEYPVVPVRHTAVQQTSSSQPS